MKIKNRICCMLLVATILGAITYLGIERTRGKYSKIMPSDFNFCVNIESDSFILNTYNNTLTKTLGWEKDTVIEFVVEHEFKEAIYSSLRSVDIYKYPYNYAPTSTVFISPSYTYKIEFTMDSIVTKVNWEEHTDSQTKDAKKLRNIFNKIDEYLMQNDKVEALPDDSRGFM